MDDLIPYLSAGLLALIAVGMVYGYLSERKAWNGGYCRKCGAPMVGFDTASDGSRGYTCVAERHRHPGCWISYSSIVGDIGERA